MQADLTPSVTNLAQDAVPIRTGPPTREELLVHYPAKFTWEQLKVFVNSGDLGLLKRDKRLQIRYEAWSVGVKEKHGSLLNYLVNERLQWGKPDTVSLIRSSVVIPPPHEAIPPSAHGDVVPSEPLVITAEAGEYFKANMSPDLISVIMNDWPYSVPPEIEHALVWTRLPVTHPAIVDRSISSRVNQDGIWGFTGLDGPPPSPSLLPTCLPALADWGVTEDRLIRSQDPSLEEQRQLKIASHEVDKFVKTRWTEQEWETAWFVNPPRLQSIPGLSHIHVFARHK